jgi:hypothetical protein
MRYNYRHTRQVPVFTTRHNDVSVRGHRVLIGIDDSAAALVFRRHHRHKVRRAEQTCNIDPILARGYII